MSESFLVNEIHTLKLESIKEKGRMESENLSLKLKIRSLKSHNMELKEKEIKLKKIIENLILNLNTTPIISITKKKLMQNKKLIKSVSNKSKGKILKLKCEKILKNSTKTIKNRIDLKNTFFKKKKILQKKSCRKSLGKSNKTIKINIKG